MGVAGVLALVLGVAVAGLLATLLRGADAETDPTMVWEARVAVGFTALVVVVPVWLAQGVATLVAEPAWLWLWLLGAPLLGGLLGARPAPGSRG